MIDSSRLNAALGQTQWLKDRGWHNTQTYDALGDDDLTQMAEGGDAFASLALGQRLALADPEAAFMHARDAAVLGYSAALALIDVVNIKRVQRASSVDKRQAIKEMAAWSLIGEMRGDPRLAANPEALTRTLAHNDLLLSDVCDAAVEIYDGLERERVARGMSPFDNSPPTYVLASAFQMQSWCPKWPSSSLIHCRIKKIDNLDPQVGISLPHRCTLR